jgi:hypothetical protein
MNITLKAVFQMFKDCWNHFYELVINSLYYRLSLWLTLAKSDKEASVFKSSSCISCVQSSLKDVNVRTYGYVP